MFKLLLLLAGLVALGAASDYYGYPYGSGGYPWWGGAPWNYWGWGGYNGLYGNNHHGYGGGYAPYNRMVFYGSFEGTCAEAHDGIYYVDERSFAYCSNGQKTIQPCAEGSANPPIAHFKHGNYYALYDFCSINLVAKGYHPKAPVHPAPAHPAPAYPAPAHPAPAHPAPKYVEQAPQQAYPSPSYEEKSNEYAPPGYEEKTQYGSYSESSYEETKY